MTIDQARQNLITAKKKLIYLGTIDHDDWDSALAFRDLEFARQDWFIFGDHDIDSRDVEKAADITEIFGVPAPELPELIEIDEAPEGFWRIDSGS